MVRNLRQRDCVPIVEGNRGCVMFGMSPPAITPFCLVLHPTRTETVPQVKLEHMTNVEPSFVLYALLLDPGCCLRAHIILIELVEPEKKKLVLHPTAVCFGVIFSHELLAWLVPRVTRKHRLVQAPGPGLTVVFLTLLVLAQRGRGVAYRLAIGCSDRQQDQARHVPGTLCPQAGPVGYPTSAPGH